MYIGGAISSCDVPIVVLGAFLLVESFYLLNGLEGELGPFALGLACDLEDEFVCPFQKGIVSIPGERLVL
jgi:hypothetical protein